MVLRREPKTRDTNEQLRVASWLRELGLGFSLEEEFSPYCADIFICDLNLIIELDGPQHLKRRDAKRDAFIKETYGIDVWRFKNREIRENFKAQFHARIMERAEIANA